MNRLALLLLTASLLASSYANAVSTTTNVPWVAPVSMPNNHANYAANEAKTIASGTCGPNLTWTLTDDGTLTISGTGEMTDHYYATDVPWCNYTAQIKNLLIQEGVTTIGQNAFDSCENLPSVTIPNSVTTIKDKAFRRCTGLTSVTIPHSVTMFGEAVFRGCSKLVAINVDANNTVLASIDGVLFTKDQSVLIHYPIGKTETNYTIPNSVTLIASGVFSGSISLSSITIGNSVTIIGEGVCNNCTALTTITNLCIVPQAGDVVFSFGNGTNIQSATLYVPSESLEAYKAAEVWKDFGTILPIEATAIEETATFSTHLYPNPASGSELTIENQNLRAGDKIELYGMNGELLGQFTASGTRTVISIDNLPAGIYLLKMKGETLKLIRGR